MSIDFETLQTLSHGKAVADAACPLCSGNCRTQAGRNRKVLRIWNKDDGFASFTCARCSGSGYAHANNNRPARRQDRPQTVVVPFKAPVDKYRLALVRSLWRRSVPARGTIVETYLRGRNCWTDSAAVRFLPERREHLPAMIVPFGMPTEPEPGVLDIATAVVHAIQLTKLKADGSGKADIEKNKIAIGAPKGWPIVLAAPSDMMALTIAEGVEDAVSDHLVSGRGAWAAGGASYLPALADRVPDYIESVTVLVDNNEAGRRNSNDLAQRLHARGIEVFLLKIWEGVA